MRSEGTSSVAFEVLKHVLKSFQLQLFDVKFLFSEKTYLSQAEKNDCYGRAFLFFVIKLSFEVPYPVDKY